MTTPAPRGSHLRLATVIIVCALACTAAVAGAGQFLGSKTPYAPQQDATTYQPPPAGFTPVFTELVARHGARGLTSPSDDLALYAMWQDAQASGSLTRLGAQLGPDIQKITRANALLGYGVSGISTPGYGNLTARGMMEHAQLAQRLTARLAPLFSTVVERANTTPRQVIVSTSGVNRAVDSANAFVKGLGASVPGLAPLIAKSEPNRFQLYFHRLNAKADQASASGPNAAIYQASQEYQRYVANDKTMRDKVNGIVDSSLSRLAARTVLDTLFTTPFLDALENGSKSYSNTGSFTFTSDDGKFTTTVKGDGETKLDSLVDAANALYALYAIAPSMEHEVPVNMGRYFSVAQLSMFAYMADAEDFYQKGPGIKEAGSVTFQMSQALLDDFIAEGDAIAAGNLAHAAKLRFTHAEIIIPFATRLGLPDATAAMAADRTYSYFNNPWRGELIAPLAANVQWDFFANGRTLLVRMLYNEKETDFAPACESARYTPKDRGRGLRGKSRYYEYAALKACYGYRASS